jgi:hypothetical protein
MLCADVAIAIRRRLDVYAVHSVCIAVVRLSCCTHTHIVESMHSKSMCWIPCMTRVCL